ncbi:MAG: histidine phosphatase family protein [Cyanobacteriota bacterium]|nr:histidine phosphatase family protein [Cyanobacteriota bacterium]
MSFTLYFLRHGETTYSAKGVYCGSLDPDLTEQGQEMAESFAEAYQGIPWSGVFVSPMKRTVATAHPLCNRLGLPMQIRSGLKEIAYGAWEGLAPHEVNQSDHDPYIRWLADPGWNAPTGGERAIDIAQRSAQVIQEIQQLCPEGSVLVVSHKATIRIMLCHLLGIDVGRFRDRIAMPVGSVSIVSFLEHGPIVRAIADRAHLAEHLRTRPGN